MWHLLIADCQQKKNRVMPSIEVSSEAIKRRVLNYLHKVVWRNRRRESSYLYKVDFILSLDWEWINFSVSVCPGNPHYCLPLKPSLLLRCPLSPQYSESTGVKPSQPNKICVVIHVVPFVEIGSQKARAIRLPLMLLYWDTKQYRDEFKRKIVFWGGVSAGNYFDPSFLLLAQTACACVCVKHQL